MVEVFDKPKLFEKPTEESITKVLFAPSHNNLGEAVLADLVDAIPFIGDLTNLIRVVNAINQKEEDFITALQAGDLLIGMVFEFAYTSSTKMLPIIDLLDLITPTNTLTYLLKKGR